MVEMTRALAAKDDFYEPYANKSVRVNVNTTMIGMTKGSNTDFI